MVFHEITKDAIQRALTETREIDERLVDAQETRRILDRLYGYEVSPVLWRKVVPGLSAGRVQSVAMRLVVERERERMAFVAASYWDSSAPSTPARSRRSSSRSRASASPRAATSATTARSRAICSFSTRTGARLAARSMARLLGALGRGEAVHAQPAGAVHDHDAAAGGEPQAPFSSQTTMRVAQRLYENGYITYMRTDSTTLSESRSRPAQAAELYGESMSRQRRAYERR